MSNGKRHFRSIVEYFEARYSLICGRSIDDNYNIEYIVVEVFPYINVLINKCSIFIEVLVNILVIGGCDYSVVFNYNNLAYRW